MFNNLYGVSSCVWEQMDTGRHVYTSLSFSPHEHLLYSRAWDSSIDHTKKLCASISSLNPLTWWLILTLSHLCGFLIPCGVVVKEFFISKSVNFPDHFLMPWSHTFTTPPLWPMREITEINKVCERCWRCRGQNTKF